MGIFFFFFAVLFLEAFFEEEFFEEEFLESLFCKSVIALLICRGSIFLAKDNLGNFFGEKSPFLKNHPIVT
jgi:hypothetical protein